MSTFPPREMQPAYHYIWCLVIKGYSATNYQSQANGMMEESFLKAYAAWKKFSEIMIILLLISQVNPKDFFGNYDNLIS